MFSDLLSKADLAVGLLTFREQRRRYGAPPFALSGWRLTRVRKSVHSSN
jgi:hypothetical protein